MIKRYQPILDNLFKKVNILADAPLENRLIALDIQKELLKRIITAERAIRLQKEKHKALKKSLNNKNNNKREAAAIKLSIKRSSDALERQNYLLWVYKSIGDSIAFIYGDRWDLKQYVFKNDAGFISGKIGLKLEVQLLKASFKWGATVVMNDLTNTMRHGDITIFRPDLWPEGGSPALFVEAKSGNGGNKERRIRQESAIKEITKYIYEDKKVAENGEWLRVSPQYSPSYHTDKVISMASSLSKKDWAHQEVETGLHYLMINCAHTEFSTSAVFTEIFPNKKNLYFLSVNDIKKQCLGYYPFPLSIKDPDILFRFYNGEFVFFVIVDMDHVNNKLKDKYLSVNCIDDSHFPWEVICEDPNKEDKIESYVGYHMIGRLASEFLSLNWVIENTIAGGLRESMETSLENKLADIKSQT